MAPFPIEFGHKAIARQFTSHILHVKQAAIQQLGNKDHLIPTHDPGFGIDVLFDREPSRNIEIEVTDNMG